MNTVEWLHESLETIHNGTPFTRLGRVWTPVAGFRNCGSILAIYKDHTEYCVHAGDDWKEDEAPLLGMYNLSLSWNELIAEIAKRYDSIRGGLS